MTGTTLMNDGGIHVIDAFARGWERSEASGAESEAPERTLPLARIRRGHDDRSREGTLKCLAPHYQSLCRAYSIVGLRIRDCRLLGGFGSPSLSLGSLPMGEFVPLKRIASPADMTGLFVFLASDDSNFMTGTTLMNDGGIHVVDAFAQGVGTLGGEWG